MKKIRARNKERYNSRPEIYGSRAFMTFPHKRMYIMFKNFTTRDILQGDFLFPTTDKRRCYEFTSHKMLDYIIYGLGGSDIRETLFDKPHKERNRRKGLRNIQIAIKTAERQMSCHSVIEYRRRVRGASR